MQPEAVTRQAERIEDGVVREGRQAVTWRAGSRDQFTGGPRGREWGDRTQLPY